MENNKIQIIDVELIKGLMRSKGIDEKEMARLVGVTPPTVKRFLSGANQAYMSSSIVYNYAKALNVPAYSLIRKDCR